MALKDIASIGARPRRAKLLTVPDSIFEEQARVMARAQHLFAHTDAYGRERKQLPGTTDLTSHGVSLLGVLRRLNITPLDPVSVRKYGQDYKSCCGVEVIKARFLCLFDSAEMMETLDMLGWSKLCRKCRENVGNGMYVYAAMSAAEPNA